MSPYRRLQQRASVTLLAGTIGILALVISVWLVGVKAASNSTSHIKESETKAHASQVAQLRFGCSRSVARDFEAVETNQDIRNLARDSFLMHRREHSTLDRRYRLIADRALFRMRKIELRLPEREDDATIAEFCRSLYPG